jgi:hypothetical protein
VELPDDSIRETEAKAKYISQFDRNDRQKTSPDRIERYLWLLAGDVDVLVRFTGHVDATVTRWLLRAGRHGERLHNLPTVLEPILRVIPLRFSGVMST